MRTTEEAWFVAVLEGERLRVSELLAADPALLQASTDETINRGIPPGSTALHLAVRYGQGEIVDLLIASGAALDARNSEGRTPLHDALAYDQRMRGRLIDAGASVDVCHAAFLDWVEHVRDLVLDDPSRVHDRTTGLSPLAWACYGNAARSARVLVDLGATPDDGELLCAAQVGGVKVGRLLLERGVDPNALHHGFNALHAALTTPFTNELSAFVSLLVEYGADVNRLTGAGQRPLDLLVHAGAVPGSPERAASLAACSELLRCHGAVPSI
jgi:ankyrin repeat and SOCS box protein 13